MMPTITIAIRSSMRLKPAARTRDGVDCFCMACVLKRVSPSPILLVWLLPGNLAAGGVVGQGGAGLHDGAGGGLGIDLRLAVAQALGDLQAGRRSQSGAQGHVA